MATDPLFKPLSATFRSAVIGAIVSQLDRSQVLMGDLDRKGAAFHGAIYNIAFLVLAQLEEGRGFDENGDRFYSNLVFTPFGESPATASKLISQEGRTIVHGGLTDEEVSDAIENYLDS